MDWFTLSLHDDGLGEASLELLASAAGHNDAMEAELQALLAQAGRLAETMGVEWAQDLQRKQDAGWTNLHLTLSGPSAWAEALAARWDR